MVYERKLDWGTTDSYDCLRVGAALEVKEPGWWYSNRKVLYKLRDEQI